MHQPRKLENEYFKLLTRYGLPLPRPMSEISGSVYKQIVSEMKNKYGDRIDGKPIEDIARQLLESKEVGLGGAIGELSMSIERGIKELKQELQIDVYAGEFPTGSFNAIAVPVAGGALLLLNTGLMMFLHKVMKIMTLSMVAAKFDETGNPIEGTESEISGYSHQEIIDILAELVLTYLHCQSPYSARRLPIIGGAKGNVHALLLKYCEMFCLAHEYGHAIGGHLNTSQSLITSTNEVEIEVIPKQWEQEFEADVIAVNVMFASLDYSLGQQKTLLNVQGIVAAPLIFFALDNLVTRVTKEVARLHGSQLPEPLTHPPSNLRSENVREFIKGSGNEGIFSLANVMVSWIEAMEDSVIQRIAELT
ncbi:MAG: hypothetical protein H6635_00150 [Anaerolineales bacterium]|nr:hypothetical protein [Anaerolineales bacterium]